MMGSSGALLTYIDDAFDSYSVIFDSAKTDIDDADRTRLIAALKTLSAGTDIESAVDVKANLLYFVVHNFVVNFDSYTGSMIHNYYLYEEDGLLTMLPWDYNLAFGGFQSSDAQSSVNYPIDTPVSGSDVASRPMLAWIFADAEYTELYHEYMDAFIAEYFESGYFAEMMDSLFAMLAPYVEKDPTKFCTYAEFEKGFDTLRQFCLLRAESVRGQLDGTIPSTSDGQAQDQSNLIRADDLSISAMGSMGGMHGGDRGGDHSSASPDMPAAPTGAFAGMSADTQANIQEQSTLPDAILTTPENKGDAQPPSQAEIPSRGDMQGNRPSDGGVSQGEVPSQNEQSGDTEQPQQPTESFPDFGENRVGSDGMQDNAQSGGSNATKENFFANRGENGFTAGNMQQTQQSLQGEWILFAVSCAVLAAGLLFAGLYKRRR